MRKKMTRPRFELQRSVHLYARGKTSVRPVIANLNVLVRIARRLGYARRDTLRDFITVAARRVFRAVRPAPSILERWKLDNQDLFTHPLPTSA